MRDVNVEACKVVSDFAQQNVLHCYEIYWDFCNLNLHSFNVKNLNAWFNDTIVPYEKNIN